MMASGFSNMSTPEHPHRLLAVATVLLFLLVPAPSLAKKVVTHLPGFQGPLPFHLETGYVTVDEANGSELFYYFIESERKPQEDPVVLWFSGGPRCSVLSGLVFEIGPLRFASAEYNGNLPNLVYHPYAWTKVANIIFLDSPVGSGFSFSRRFQGYDGGDVAWSKHAHKFLIKWFNEHPRFLINPLYIGGDSYAGKIVPVIAHEISNAAKTEKEFILNLKGYVIGNPVTGDKIDENSQVEYSHGFGLIPDQLYELIERNCEGQDHRTPDAQCADSLEAFYRIKSEVQEGYILDPLCPAVFPKSKELIHGRRSIRDDKYLELFDPPIHHPPQKCRLYIYVLADYWANSNLTRNALGIKKGTVPEWIRCNSALPYRKDVASSINYHFNLTARGYRALVYSGDHDLTIPYVGTHKWIQSFNYSIVDGWRSWRIVDGQVAGYSIVYENNLTFATVKNAGHTAPEYKAEECLAMFRRWISHKPL